HPARHPFPTRRSSDLAGDTGAMRAIVYSSAGGPEVLRLVDKQPVEPGAGELRVRIAVSGVNPTDWKSRAGTDPGHDQVPDQDGADRKSTRLNSSHLVP